MDEHQSQPNMLPGRIRVVYFGTPEYAVPALQLLVADNRFEVSLVVTQPDRPAGRRHLLTEPPVKIAAREAGLHVYQPESLRRPEARTPLIEADAAVFVVAAYGLIFGEKTLAMPRAGCVNLHASLLPKYRGASPIAGAILAGEAETGVSLMRMERGLDTGPVYASSKTAIEPAETTDRLTERLAGIGGALLEEHLMAIVKGILQPVPQDESMATTTRLIAKSDGAIDWNDSALSIERQVRAMWPWPRAWTGGENGPLQIHRSEVGPQLESAEPGTIVTRGADVLVSCGRNTSLLVSVVQPAGGKPMDARSWLAGTRGTVQHLRTPGVALERSPLIESVPSR